MTILHSHFDKAVERYIEFWQQERNCLIVINEEDGQRSMDILYLTTGEIEQNIDLGSVDCYKEQFMMAIRKHFKH